MQHVSGVYVPVNNIYQYWKVHVFIDIFKDQSAGMCIIYLYNHSWWYIYDLDGY